jgi:hypothetical protein
VLQSLTTALTIQQTYLREGSERNGLKDLFNSGDQLFLKALKKEASSVVSGQKNVLRNSVSYLILVSVSIV